MSKNDKSSGPLLLHQRNEVHLYTLREQDDSLEDDFGGLVCLDGELDCPDIADCRLLGAHDLGVPGFCQDVVLRPSHQVEQLSPIGFLDEEVVVSGVAG